MDETASGVAADRPLIKSEHAQIDAMQPHDAEGVVEGQAYRRAPDTAAQIGLCEQAYGETRTLVGLLKTMEPHMPDRVPVTQNDLGERMVPQPPDPPLGSLKIRPRRRGGVAAIHPDDFSHWRMREMNLSVLVQRVAEQD